MHESQVVGFGAEMLVASRLCHARQVVSLPLVVTTYDLLADSGNRIWRIQVKTGWLQKAKIRKAGKGDRAGYVIGLTAHKKGVKHKRRLASGFDYLAAVCSADLIYLIPVSELTEDEYLPRQIVIKPLELLENTRADSAAAAERWEKWKNNFVLHFPLDSP